MASNCNKDCGARVFGVRVESATAGAVGTKDGLVHIRPDSNVFVVLFGSRLNISNDVFLATDIECKTGRVNVSKIITSTGSFVRARLSLAASTEQMYACHGRANQSTKWATIVPDLEVSHVYLPIYVAVPVVLVCLLLSALFTGLSLGVMSLDPIQLQLIGETGTKSERSDVRKIAPLRRRSNFTLCSLLLGMAVTNAAVTIILENLAESIPYRTAAAAFSIVVPSVLIVLGTEIIPQSICHKRGLRIGAKTRLLTLGTMAVTCVFSWPLSKVLDWILGEEGRVVYDRHRLLAVIKLQKKHIGLSDAGEMQLVDGALRASHNRLYDVMTLFGDIFMVSTDEVLSSRFVAEIIASGYTRIPVYEGNQRERICSVLNVKDLALIDPDDNLRVGTVCNFWQSSVHFALEDTPLKAVLKEMSRGDHHLTMVVRKNPKTRSYELIGLCTLEDVIEDIIQMEIVDETDRVMNNVERRRRGRNMNNLRAACDNQVALHAQLRQAAVLFLNDKLPLVFGFFQTKILEQMLRENSYKMLPGEQLYEKNKPSSYFSLVLEGRVTVTIGHASYSTGSFYYFGVNCLHKTLMTITEDDHDTSVIVRSDNNGNIAFVPDYTATVEQETIIFRLRSDCYQNAFERSDMMTRIENMNPRKLKIASILLSQETQRESVKIKSM